MRHLTEIGFVWKIHRRTDEQNIPLRPAYTISNRAKKYLEESGHIPLPAREPSPFMLDHALAINDVLILVDLLCRHQPERFKLLHLAHDRDLRSRKLNLPLVPDGFFEIADIKLSKSYPTLLEVDLATEERVRWQEKIEKYLQIFGKEAKRVFDFPHPDVLCLTKADHVQELKKWTEVVIKQQAFEGHEQLFYFAALPNGTRLNDFFFTARFLQGGSTQSTQLFSP